MIDPLPLIAWLQVIESLALEDTGIQAEHIAQIKELIQKEDIIQSRATK